MYPSYYPFRARIRQQKRRTLGVISLFALSIAWVCLSFVGSSEDLPRKMVEGPQKVDDQVPPFSLSVLASLCPAVTQASYRQKEVYAALNDAAQSHQLEVELLIAVMAAESRCRISARSRAGALGLMQLMPRTAKWLGVEDPLSVRDNVFGGAKYLAFLLDSFEGNMELALAAYNSGPTTVRRYNSIPPYRETIKYVERVMAYYGQLRDTPSTSEA